jgi:hypothetical protein
MLRHLLTFAICLTLSAPALAQSDAVKPVSTSDVGPWEAVLWTRGPLVYRCTLTRARNAPEGLLYGFLIDGQGILLGVTHKNWAFKSEAPVQAMVTPQTGTEQKLTARPASNLRANVELPRAMLDAFQRSEHTDVQIDGIKVRLPLDDLNAARVTLEICVQKIGKKN